MMKMFLWLMLLLLLLQVVLVVPHGYMIVVDKDHKWVADDGKLFGHRFSNHS
jgi:hypothetical protein